MLLLPGTYLPLNVFEPRYRQLVSRAMETDRRIAMIQPVEPAPDHLGPTGDRSPRLYDVGCVGELVECERQPDGRYHVVLRGLTRFRVVDELAVAEGGYRRVHADLTGFEGDLEELGSDFEVEALLSAVAGFADHLGFELDMELLASLPPAHAVNALAAALPFGAAEKQALLEAPDPRRRLELLSGLIAMHDGGAGDGPADPRTFEPPIVN